MRGGPHRGSTSFFPLISPHFSSYIILGRTLAVSLAGWWKLRHSLYWTFFLSKVFEMSHSQRHPTVILSRETLRVSPGHLVQLKQLAHIWGPSRPQMQSSENYDGPSSHRLKERITSETHFKLICFLSVDAKMWFSPTFKGMLHLRCACLSGWIRLPLFPDVLKAV